MSNFIKIFISTVSFVVLLLANFLVFDVYSKEELLNATPKVLFLIITVLLFFYIISLFNRKDKN